MFLLEAGDDLLGFIDRTGKHGRFAGKVQPVVGQVPLGKFFHPFQKELLGFVEVAGPQLAFGPIIMGSFGERPLGIGVVGRLEPAERLRVIAQRLFAQPLPIPGGDGLPLVRALRGRIPPSPADSEPIRTERSPRSDGPRRPATTWEIPPAPAGMFATPIRIARRGSESSPGSSALAEPADRSCLRPAARTSRRPHDPDVAPRRPAPGRTWNRRPVGCGETARAPF